MRARASRPQLQRDPLTRTQHGSRPMRATPQLDVATRSHGAGVRPLRALLVACFLALAPMLAFAQQPAPTPVPRDTSPAAQLQQMMGDRKSTRLNSSHSQISYAVFCLKKKKKSESKDM